MTFSLQQGDTTVSTDKMFWTLISLHNEYSIDAAVFQKMPTDRTKNGAETTMSCMGIHFRQGRRYNDFLNAVRRKDFPKTAKTGD
jgi:hypothetical protein